MLLFDLDASTALAVAALLLLAWDASRQDRSPLAVLAGLGMLLAAVLLRLFGGGGLLPNVGGVLVDTGVAFLLASLLMAVRRARAMAFFFIGILALALALLLFAGTRLLRAGMADADTAGSLVLELGPDDRIEEVMPLLQASGIRAEPAFPSLNLADDEDLAQMFVLTGPQSALDELDDALRADRENVDFVEWNRTVTLWEPLPGERAAAAERAPIVANDPLIASQWALTAIRGHEAHALLRHAAPRRKALVAILDTGVDADHEDLTSIFHRSPGTSDLVGHGTHCAGIAGAPANNGVGIASLNWEGRFIDVASFQALPANGAGTYESIAQAVIDATQAGADVLSLSLGDYTETPPRVVSEAIAYAFEHGAIVVASAGNGNQDAVDHMPSNIPGVIAVAAVDRQMQKARFSNTIASLSRPIAAPGVDILSLKPGQQYVPLSGTSMAAPLVAGLLGIMRALDPDLSAEDAYRILHETGTTGDEAVRTGRTINAEAALRSVMQSM